MSDQQPFVEAAQDILGEWGVLPMIAYGKLKNASAWKMYARAKGVDPETANEVSKGIQKYEKALRYAKEQYEDEEGVADEDADYGVKLSSYVPEQYMQMVAESEQYMGVIDSYSPHPCAHLLLDGDIRYEIGVIRLKKQDGATQVAAAIDGATAERYGYLKMDFLVVSVVDIISSSFAKLGMPVPSEKALLELVRNDPKTWAMYANGYTMGLNQVEQVATRDRAMQYRPNNVVELSSFVAAVRPGFKSMLDTFLSRTKFAYNIPALDKLLQTKEIPSSFLLYQEQVMQVLQAAGISASESYNCIKAISKKNAAKIASFKDAFLQGFTAYIMREDGTDEQSARAATETIWGIIEDNAQYSFNACVAGDTRIHRRPNNKWEPTVEEMYLSRNNRVWAIDNNHKPLMDKLRAYGYGMALSMDDGEAMTINDIIDIRNAGTDDIYRLTTQTGRYLDCTMNHRFPTPNGTRRLDEMNVGDELYILEWPNRVWYSLRAGKWVFSDIDKVASIEFLRHDTVFDVEMDDPFHNYVANNGIITCNSHAYCMALDSLYGAWLKAHHPFEFYMALLENYTKKGKKEKIPLLKNEMFEAYDIRMVPPKYGMDNTAYSVDRENNTIADALTSIKGIGMPTAVALRDIRGAGCGTFVDLLALMAETPAINKQHVATLIMLDYFSAYGSREKLLKVHEEFLDGPNCYKKTYVQKTKEKRLEALRVYEAVAVGDPLSPVDVIAFEVKHVGMPVTQWQGARSVYAVIDVDDKYTPRVTLANIKTGRTGTMKIRKPKFQSAPLHVGSVVHVVQWHESQPFKTKEGYMVPAGMWLDDYLVDEMAASCIQAAS